MNDEERLRVDVSVRTRYLERESDPEGGRYVFAYTITLRNTGTVGARLLTRHWIITDGDQRDQQVDGEGVVGRQPHLRPGQQYEYTSGAVLATPVGVMRGFYGMKADDGTEFRAPIPAFRLAMPGVLQ